MIIFNQHSSMRRLCNYSSESQINYPFINEERVNKGEYHLNFSLRSEDDSQAAPHQRPLPLLTNKGILIILFQ